MKYFRLQSPERAALEMVDGETSYHQIKTNLAQQFPEESIRITDVHMLINSFHKNGLLISDTTGQATPLKHRRSQELKQKWTQLLMSVMSLRFPGVDPERFLNWLYPKVRWAFSKTCTFICLAICFCALLLVLQNLDEFYRKLPEFETFFDVKNLLFMAFLLIATKSIHELGHGLMCKHYGGECHEMGVMLLVLTPAMYCNTSDSWILPNKWHRIAIGVAGMYVEVVLAAICTFVWWYTQPGAIHYMALNVIFLCSISTLIFNANPLLRYDGYYMLSDFLEIPNLGSKSRMSLISKLRTWCLGMKPINPRLLPKRRQAAFAIYAVASFCYRWFIMLMIFWFLTKVFEPYGLSVLGHAMILLSVIGMIGIPVCKVVKFFLYPGRFREVNKIRFVCSAVLLLVLIGGVYLVPVPHSVPASFVVQPVDQQKVYVSQAGVLAKILVEPGEVVLKGDTIAVLEDEDLQLEIERLKGNLAAANANLAAFQLKAERGEEASRNIVAWKTKVEDIEKRIAIRQKMITELTLIADRDGVIIPPPNLVAPPSTPKRTLASWSGTPLQAENRGAYLESQTLYCLVGDPKKMKAMLVVDQANAKFIEPGQKVTLMLDEYVGTKLNSEIQFVSREPMSSVPRELSLNHGGTIATKPESNKAMLPLLPAFEATALLDTDDNLDLLPGFRGHAKINVGTATLGKRAIRYLSTLINFR